jgi:hypothetical protein
MKKPELSEELRQKLLRDAGVGPTGDYPQGKLNAEDEGGLIIAISTKDNAVRVDFGKPVAWIAYDADTAIGFAHALIERALALKAGEAKP